MKNKLYITITDFRGVKCYSFNKVIKKYLAGVLCLFFSGIAVLGIMTFILKKKLEEYEYYKIENTKLQAQVENNRNELEAKNIELENINEKIEEIEKIIGEESYTSLEEEKISSVKEEIDFSKISLSERKYLLQLIPNGNPVIPFKGYTSKFGGRFHPILEKRKFHYGLDFAAPIGTTIVAPADGVVEFAGYNRGGFGNLVILSHNYGFKTYFAHMSKIDVAVGDFVYKGEILGKSGNTGRSSGPHLHYEIHHLGKRVNPEDFARWELKNYNELFEREKGEKWHYLIEIAKAQTQIFYQKE